MWAVEEEILVKFGERVKSLRRSRGMSQEQLAELAGVHRTYIGMIERAEKNITLVNIQKIARAFGISVADIFRGDGN